MDVQTERYAAYISSIPDLSAETERQLMRQWREHGDLRSRNKVILANMKIAVAVARQHHRFGLEIKDMIALGAVGLIHASEKYDLDRENRFGSYAWHWVRAMVTRAECRQWHSVSGQPTGTRRLFSMLKAHGKALALYGNDRQAIHQYLAEQICVPVHTAELWLNHICSREISLETTYRGHDEAPDSYCMKDDLVDGKEMPDAAASRSEIRRLVQERIEPFMQTLSSRQLKIVKRRFMADEPCSLDTIGKEEGITRERVRQIETVLKAKFREILADIARQLGFDTAEVISHVFVISQAA